MLFSIIIPTYNRLDLLKRALQSVWKQTSTDFEILVVDDGSNDGTHDYLVSLGSKVRALKQPNLGPGAARNLGAQRAEGKYLAFLDSDDIWFPWTLATFKKVIDLYRSPAIISSCLKTFVIEEELTELRSKMRAVSFSDYFEGAKKGYFVGSNMAVISRSAFLRVGGFHTLRQNAEDHDLILRMGLEAGFVQIISPVTLGWRQHSESETRAIKRSFEGVHRLILQEKQNYYPGGRARRTDRVHIISQHVRSAAVECVRHGFRREAWHLYFASLAWQAKLGRFKFVLGFPVKAISEVLRGAIR